MKKELRELVMLKKRYVELRILYGRTKDTEKKRLLKGEILLVVNRAGKIRRRLLQ